MPIHPHHCTNCDRDFEVLTLSLNAPVDPTCEVCGFAAERRFGVPCIKTNATFFRGAKYGGEEFQGDQQVLDAYTGPAKKAGVSIVGKTYQAQLARFPGDPQAFVSDLDDARRRCRELGYGSEQLGVKAIEKEPEPSKALGRDIVNQELARMVEQGKIEPTVAAVEKAREGVTDKMTPYWQKPGYVGSSKKPKRSKKAKTR